jgi:hypothetical protein
MAEALASTRAVLQSANEEIQGGNRLAMAGIAAGTLAMAAYHFGGAELTYAHTFNGAYIAAKHLVDTIPADTPLREYYNYLIPAATGAALGTTSWIVERLFTAGTVKAVQQFPKTTKTYEEIRYAGAEPPAPAQGIRSAQFVLGTGSPGMVLRSAAQSPGEPLATHRKIGNRTSNQLFVINATLGTVAGAGMMSGDMSGFSNVTETALDYAQKWWLWVPLLAGPPLLKVAGKLVKAQFTKTEATAEEGHIGRHRRIEFAETENGRHSPEFLEYVRTRPKTLVDVLAQERTAT